MSGPFFSRIGFSLVSKMNSISEDYLDSGAERILDSGAERIHDSGAERIHVPPETTPAPAARRGVAFP